MANLPRDLCRAGTRSRAPAVEAQRPDASFHCDGRVYCSQMTSCEEAMFFLQNCPGVKMDGEGDGIPCEKQWCGIADAPRSG